MKRLALVLGLASICRIASGAELELEQNAEQNVVASRIEGLWVVEPKLKKRLGGERSRDVNIEGIPGPVGIIHFKSDPGMLAKVPDAYADKLKEGGMKIYLAGKFEAGEESYPFLLTNIAGNPHVLFFRKLEDGSLDGESFNVMLARGKEPGQDLLFIGGDFNNTKFVAFRRENRLEGAAAEELEITIPKARGTRTGYRRHRP